MSEKTVVFTPEAGGAGGNGMMAMLAPLLQQKGIDPNLLVAMQGKNGNNGFGDGGFLWILFLFFLFPLFNRGGFGGFGGNDGGNGAAGIPNLINNDAGRELLMSAIQGNGNAINQLASTLNCSVGQIQQSINAVTTQLQQVGNQVGMSSMQVINAVQAGNTQIAQAICDCCCQTQNAITKMGYENQISTLNLGNTLQNTMNANTLSLRDGATANSQAIIAKLDAMEARHCQEKIDQLTSEKLALQGQISQLNQNGFISATIQANTAPLANALAGLQNEVDAIKCKLPNTISVQYPSVRCYNPEIFQAAAAGAAYGDFAAQGLYNNGCGC